MEDPTADVSRKQGRGLVSVVGLGDDPAKATAQVRRLLLAAQDTQTYVVDLLSISPEALHTEMVTRGRKLNVEVEVRRGSDEDQRAMGPSFTRATLTISGCGASQVRAHAMALRHHAEDLDKQHQRRRLAPFWQGAQPSQDEDFVYANVEPGSTEWNMVASRFLHDVSPPESASMPAGTVMERLQRVHNPVVWDAYAKQRWKVERECCGQPGLLHDQLLFHGPYKLDPKIIAGTNFDFRFSGDQNMWGRGTYFAYNAMYSHQHKYAFDMGDGRKQMFAARVALGQTHVCAANSKMAKPPFGFQSVGGRTRGSDVFIIYELHQAYPRI